MAMQLITYLSDEKLVLSVLVEVVSGVEGKEDYHFQGTLLVVYPLLGVGVPIWEAIKVPVIQP